MAISFGTGTVKKMVQWWSGDTLTGWGGANDGLDGFGAQIEGTSCVVIAARKNETIQVTYTAALNSVPAGSQLIFNNYTVLGNILNSLSITVNDGATGTATFNILSEFTGAGSSLNLKSFVAIAMDLEAGTLNPAANNLADISYDLVTQNVSLRATDNFFLDAAYVGDGVTLEGTTVSNVLFSEAQLQDITNDIHNGVLQSFEGVIFAQHDIDINTTTGNSDNESLTFIETLNGANSYEINGTGTAVFTGTNIQTTGTVTSVINMSNMTAFTMTGGSFKLITTVSFGANTIQRATFNDITTFNSGTGTFVANVLDTITTANLQTTSTSVRLQACDNVTLTSTSDLIDSIIEDSGRIDISGGNRDILRCQFTDPSATTAAVLASSTTISNITNSTFIRTTGTTNAVSISDTISTDTTVTWDGNQLTGYGTGVAGTGVSSTAGGAIEATLASSAVLTIRVINEASIPTVEFTGTGTVNVAVIVPVTISGLLGNTEVSVLQNPSPYSQAGASPTTLFDEDVLSAVTGTDIDLDTNGTANIIQILSTTTDFTTIGLVNGDKVRVSQRSNLKIFDTYTVEGTPTAGVINVTDVASSTSKLPAIIDSPGETVTVEKVGASYSFEVEDGQVIDILAFRVGSLPIYQLTQTISITNNSFPLTQTVDRNFDAFEV
tara:strand:- start:3543 stop:5540 length:1998 start_codon:yes stop_codon:yes gene_type:complete